MRGRERARTTKRAENKVESKQTTEKKTKKKTRNEHEILDRNYEYCMLYENYEISGEQGEEI